MLVSAKEMLVKAKKGKYAVGQFNINNLEWTKAILLTAQENNSPVILGVSEGAGKYMCGYKTIVGMVEGMLDKLHSNYLNSYSEAHVVEGAKEVVGELYKENNLFFVTARNSTLEEITMDWLKKQELSYVPLYLLGTDRKLNKAKELECDIFIEDHPMNALHLAEGGIKVILIDCNYNKDIDHKNIIRVSSWKEIKNVIDKL